jgi:predicted enzyme related to lactoylglutathione lyase
VATRLSHVVIDANDPGTLARFWAAALDWPIVIDDPHEVEIGPGSEGDVPLIFVPVPEPKVTKNRLHLDLPSRTEDEQRATVERLLDLGATRADIGQGDVPWVVLADPEGNEFCVLPASFGAHTMPIGSISMDAADAPRMADFWSAATGWPVTKRDEYSALFPGLGPVITMGPPVAPKRGKNRIHLDVRPDPGGDTQAEADRLIALGATRIDIGQRGVSWVVLADPEGNEFCVLTPRSA